MTAISVKWDGFWEEQLQYNRSCFLPHFCWHSLVLINDLCLYFTMPTYSHSVFFTAEQYYVPMLKSF